jgi:hypothetical protein
MPDGQRRVVWFLNGKSFSMHRLKDFCHFSGEDAPGFSARWPRRPRLLLSDPTKEEPSQAVSPDLSPELPEGEEGN